MASIASPQNTNSLDLDPVVKANGTAYLKRGIATKTATGITPDTIAQVVGTHEDDAAFVAADAVVGIGGLADETATDSVDEGDVGLLRMTLNRRLITAGQFVDDAAYTPATDYATVIGAMADDTSPDSVNEGDAGALRMTLARHLLVSETADAAAVTTVNSTASSTTLLAANANRIGAMIHNTDANALYVKFGATASTTSFTVKIASDGYYEFPHPVYRGVVDGIWSADGAGLAAITELT